MNWIGLTCLAGLVFVVSLIVGIVRKKVWLIIVAVIAVFVTMVTGYTAFVRISTVAIHAISKTTTERTAEEVFAAEFDRPQNNCVQVIDYYDPTVTVINDRRMICFSACPAETGRIMKRRRYDVAERATPEVAGSMSDKCCQNFVTTERFGATVWECLASEGTDSYTMYVSMDSTRVYYIREMK